MVPSRHMRVGSIGSALNAAKLVAALLLVALVCGEKGEEGAREQAREACGGRRRAREGRQSALRQQLRRDVLVGCCVCGDLAVWTRSLR